MNAKELTTKILNLVDNWDEYGIGDRYLTVTNVLSSAFADRDKLIIDLNKAVKELMDRCDKHAFELEEAKTTFMREYKDGKDLVDQLMYRVDAFRLGREDESELRDAIESLLETLDDPRCCWSSKSSCKLCVGLKASALDKAKEQGFMDGEKFLQKIDEKKREWLLEQKALIEQARAEGYQEAIVTKETGTLPDFFVNAIKREAYEQSRQAGLVDAAKIAFDMARELKDKPEEIIALRIAEQIRQAAKEIK